MSWFALEDSEFLDAFIEETLRMQSPIQAWFRRATEDVEIQGGGPKDSRLLVVRLREPRR